VLEWLEGMPLSRMLARERAEGRAHWTIEEMMGMLAPVASALDVAHARGIAHRDIKPGNLFVLGDLTRGGPLMIKILDFGLAKLMADQTHLHAALAKTGTSIKAFTPAFAAPEQFSRSYGATGPWTDVFALALVAIRMLCGRRPLQGDDAVQLAYSACHHEHRPTPRALGATVSDDVERVFAKALAVQPADRYARAGEFWSALHIAVYGAHGPSLPAAMQGPQSPGPPQSPSAALPARPASLSPGPAFSLRPSLSPGPSLPSGPLPSPGPAFAPGSNVSASAVGADAPPRRATLGSALGLVGALVVVAAVAFGALLFALERGRRGESPPPSASASAPAPLVPIDPNLKPAPCARKRPRRSRPASFSWARMAKTRRPTRNLRIT